MGLTIHNTLARAKQAFVPLDPNHVRMYVCGPTVYDFAHIGNARPVVVFDVLYRLLKRLYPRVTYVRNITDVDDKIIDRARANGEPIDALTARATEAFHADMQALGTLDPDAEPRATEYVDRMIAMIGNLIASGHAYEAEGHVLFHTASMRDYGALSRHSRDELIAGARVDVAPYKRDPADFVLWKPSGGGLPGWTSPWGRGRPGWHIECSAMSSAHLGETFDIHGGGADLIFPHHENERAQSVCAHGGREQARYWMHNGYLVVNGEKMSKSLGNFMTVRELLNDVPGEAIRLALLQAHYRAPLDLSRTGLAEAKAALDRLYRALRDSHDAARPDRGDDVGPSAAVLEALLDDLNTPAAVAALHGTATMLNRARDPAERARLRAELLAAGDLLGLLRSDPQEWLHGAGDDTAEIETMVAERVAARRERDFARSDAIRDALTARGIALEDGPQGTSWRRTG